MICTFSYFSLYTSEERLGQEDAFFCPQCNKKREGVKKLGVWSVPDVLVVHLKRFRHSTSSSNKLDTMVEFPLDNFDMGPNMARQQQQQEQSASPPVPDNNQNQTSNLSHGLKALTAFSPWKNPKRFREGGGVEDTKYELYGVCNHHGSDLQGGHYTAYCRNPTDGQWYNFDDVNTNNINEEEIVTKDAYILFYQKSSLSPSSSSASSSSSGSGQDHWVYRMPDFCYRAKNQTRYAPANRTKSRTRQPKKSVNVNKSSEGKAEADSSFVRNSRKYSTLPPKRTSDLITVEAENYSDTEAGPDGTESDDETQSPSR